MSDINQKDHLVMLNESSNEAVVPIEKNRASAKYFRIPFAAFLVLYLFTGSYFKIYWLYCNWKAIKRAEKHNISPFWRSIFAVFFIDEFFEHVFNSAKKQGYTKFANHRLLSNFYIACLGLSLTFGVLTIFTRSSILYNGASYSNLTSVTIWGWVFAILAILFGMVRELCFYPVQKAINFYQDKVEQENLTALASNPTSPVIGYFDVSPTRFLIFNILTARLYSLYWAYKNWQAIKRAENRNIVPFWRGLFSVFFIYNLFKKIYHSAREQGFSKSIPYGQLSIIYIFLCLFLIFLARFVTRLPEYMSEYWYDIFIIGVGVTFDVLCFRPLQKAIHFYNNKTIRNYKPRQGVSRGEVLMLIIGGLYCVVLLKAKLEVPKKPSSMAFTQSLTTWKTFQPASKAFEIKFPTQPSYEKEELPIEDTKLKIKYECYESTTDQGVNYSVSHMNYPADVELTEFDLNNFIEDIVQSSSSNKLLNSVESYVGKHKAVDFLIQNRFVYMRGRVILVGQTKYLLMSSYAEESYNEEQYKNFINSFSLKETL
ncbi:hypothetical protein Aasi_1361 [Candidatus Amoebophilus asiaticus 5a2]|uniref:DUF4234 domain-containing protein n=1 Tax=Amoebophilus asiaticus (strain 5a2) TaxID=452471 RepID=B3ETW3_AMOA5|nr:hypothetical protein [Candidatus Amoebophilus asiaticus]ACE06665.1 hypothetical protein Aasi_1361 [Candidatus Amoebophilus asiaticus 5a2]